MRIVELYHFRARMYDPLTGRFLVVIRSGTGIATTYILIHLVFHGQTRRENAPLCWFDGASWGIYVDSPVEALLREMMLMAL